LYKNFKKGMESEDGIEGGEESNFLGEIMLVEAGPASSETISKMELKRENRFKKIEDYKANHLTKGQKNWKRRQKLFKERLSTLTTGLNY
jgi:hypothetical protein